MTNDPSNPSSLPPSQLLFKVTTPKMTRQWKRQRRRPRLSPPLLLDGSQASTKVSKTPAQLYPLFRCHQSPLHWCKKEVKKHMFTLLMR